MKKTKSSVLFVAAVFLAFALGTSVSAANPAHNHAAHDQSHKTAVVLTKAMQHHIDHVAEALPASWTDQQVRDFVKASNTAIKLAVNRNVAIGETVIIDDMPFTVYDANAPADELRQACKKCPQINRCH